MQPVQLFLLDAGLMAILADVLHVLEAPLPQQLLLQAVDNALTPLDFLLLKVHSALNRFDIVIFLSLTLLKDHHAVVRLLAHHFRLGMRHSTSAAAAARPIRQVPRDGLAGSLRRLVVLLAVRSLASNFSKATI